VIVRREVRGVAGEEKRMSIILYQYRPLFGLPNASPFCVKLETYLRMADLPYEARTLKGPSKSPTGKAPYIKIDGTLITDSGIVIDYLEQRHGRPVDGKLTLAERAQALAFQRLMEEHLYWVTVYARWVDPAHSAETTAYASAAMGVKGLFAKVLVPVVKRQVKKALWHHGLGRHDAAQIWKFGIEDVQALSHWLGARPWCFGEQPTSLDATLFSAVSCITHTPWDFPLKTETLKCRNLVDHAQRMLAKYFPELAAETAKP
jgi:glutathione S-transferase